MSQNQALYQDDGNGLHTTETFENDCKSVCVTETECRQDRQSSGDQTPQSTSWQPAWLKKPVLYAFAGLFTAMDTALIIMWRFSVIQDGFSLTLTRNHYAWTYGPTAVLAVVVSLWRQVDYYCKSLSPWQNLKAGPASASKTVLLDYISVLQINALIKAVRLKNFAVAVTVIGFALLKLCLIFSTGLLVLMPTPINDPTARAVITNKFDALLLNASLPPGDSGLYASTSGRDTGDVSLYYATIAYGSKTFDDTFNDTTFQSFVSLDRDRNLTSLSTIVDVFKPTTRCEIVQATISHDGQNHLQVDAPTCHVDLVVDGDIAMPGPNPRICKPRILLPTMERVNCSAAPSQLSNRKDDTSIGEWHWLVTISESRYIGTLKLKGQTANNLTYCSYSTAQIAAVLCQLKYEILRLPVSYIFTPNLRPRSEIQTFQKNETLPGRQLRGMTDRQLNAAVMRALSGIVPSMSPLVDAVEVLHYLMDLRAGGNGSYEKLLSNLTLRDMAQLTFNGVSNLVAHQNLLVADSTEVNATMTYIEDRLHIRYLSLWSMMSLFTVMIILSLLLVAIRPYKPVPCDPNSLAASAVILGFSDIAFQRCLSCLGYNRESFMRLRLDGCVFHTRMTNRFAVSMLDTQRFKGQRHDNKKICQKTRQWYPWAVRYVVLVPTVLIPVIAIAVLEIMQRASDARQGIVSISDGEKTKENTFYYLTSLVLLLIATIYNNLDFNIAVFAPLSALRAHCLPANRGITFHLIGQIPIFALWRTVKARHFGASLSSIAGFVGSTLTIIGSGLWLLDHTTLFSVDISVQRLDVWNTTWNNFKADSEATMIYSVREHQNISYPRWTFDELAFPQVNHDSSDESQFRNALESLSGDNSLIANRTDGTRNYKLKLPALRANLNCNLATSDDQSAVWLYHDNLYLVMIRLPLPQHCLGGPSRNESWIVVELSFNLNKASNATHGKYVAHFWGLKQDSSIYVANGPQYGQDLAAVDPGCPSLVFASGYAQSNSTSSESITAMICYQELQEVETVLSLTQKLVAGIAQPPVIDDSSPPVPDEHSLRRLTNGTAKVFSWKPQSMLTSNLQHVNQTGIHLNANNNGGIDAFFDNVFNKSGDYDIESYMGPANAAKLTQAINHAYRQYMAQVISANMRVPRNRSFSLENNADSTMTFKARSITPTPRMKMNRTTKFVLQVELMVMVLCGTAAFFMVKIRGTMAHNPCTIAGTMSLLAGSEMVENMPVGAETASGKELEKLLSKEGKLYSLGWWNTDVDGGGKIRRFGVDIGRAEPI